MATPKSVVPNDPKTSSIGDYVWIDTNRDGMERACSACARSLSAMPLR